MVTSKWTILRRMFQRNTISCSSKCNFSFDNFRMRALRPIKSKSKRLQPKYFTDVKLVRVVGGKGGDGCISFLQLWCNEKAGPDGGDGGNGGHVIFQASKNVSNLNHLSNVIQAESGRNGRSKECHGKNGNHTIIRVPIGSIIREKCSSIAGDLNKDNLMFVAAKGGAGGKGNGFFKSDKNHTPKICEYGALGEDLNYIIEMKSFADIGIIGYPNAGKSTLLNAITRARPKVAPYAFTTLLPHIGMIEHTDYTQLAVADLPGIIPDSYRNRGLGIQFLKHIERCSVLLFLLDASNEDLWMDYQKLLLEIQKFNKCLLNYPRIIVINKIDKEHTILAINLLKNEVEKYDIPVVSISAKYGTNLEHLVTVMRQIFEKYQEPSLN